MPTPLPLLALMTFEMLTDTFTRASLEKLLSRESYASDAEYERNIDKTMSSGGFLREIAEKTGLPESVFVEVDGFGTHALVVAETEGGWQVRRLCDGSTEWTAPTSRKYVKPPATYPIDRTAPPDQGAGPRPA